MKYVIMHHYIRMSKYERVNYLEYKSVTSFHMLSGLTEMYSASDVGSAVQVLRTRVE